jgi:hypothetical protein
MDSVHSYHCLECDVCECLFRDTWGGELGAHGGGKPPGGQEANLDFECMEGVLEFNVTGCIEFSADYWSLFDLWVCCDTCTAASLGEQGHHASLAGA